MKTRLCKFGKNCNDRRCNFAHYEYELIDPNHLNYLETKCRKRKSKIHKLFDDKNYLIKDIKILDQENQKLIKEIHELTTENNILKNRDSVLLNENSNLKQALQLANRKVIELERRFLIKKYDDEYTNYSNMVNDFVDKINKDQDV